MMRGDVIPRKTRVVYTRCYSLRDFFFFFFFFFFSYTFVTLCVFIRGEEEMEEKFIAFIYTGIMLFIFFHIRLTVRVCNIYIFFERNWEWMLGR